MSFLDKWVQTKAMETNYLTVPEFDLDGSFSGFYSKNSADYNVVGGGFDSYVNKVYKENGVVFACVMARMLPFSEIRFQYQQYSGGRPGKLFGNASLSILENPWVNGTTGELLARMEQDVSLAGNFYATVIKDSSGSRIRRLRPDWVTIISGVRVDSRATTHDARSEILAYIYDPGDGTEPLMLTASQVVHYSPIPDPAAQWRGMSWITPIVNEIRADNMATAHKLRFYRNGAQLSTVVSYDKSLSPDNFQRYVTMFEEAHGGIDNAYKTLHIGGGADVSVVGTDLKTDFRAVQGAGETRIAAAAGVGAIIARFSEGLSGSALNQGNYAAAKRQFSDMTLRPLWRVAAASLSKMVNVPVNSRLWYDHRDVEFLKEDRKDAAEIMSITATTISSLVAAGYTPDSVVLAIDTGDLDKLLHSGLYSVQLQDPTSAVIV